MLLKLMNGTSAGLATEHASKNMGENFFTSLPCLFGYCLCQVQGTVTAPFQNTYVPWSPSLKRINKTKMDWDKEGRCYKTMTWHNHCTNRASFRTTILLLEKPLKYASQGWFGVLKQHGYCIVFSLQYTPHVLLSFIVYPFSILLWKETRTEGRVTVLLGEIKEGEGG